MDLDQLRAEIQTDRIAIQRTIDAGFDRIIDKMEEHSASDAAMFASLDKRISSVEETQGRMVKAITGAISVAFTAFIGWIMSLFGKG